jgi:conjugal transfer mating pair stabilization protein TraN
MQIRVIFLSFLLCLIFISLLSGSNSFAFDVESCKIIQKKDCAEYSEKVVDGIPTTQCWKYVEKSICISKEQNNCVLFENNRGCRESKAECLEHTSLGHCKNYQKKFICSSKFNENAEIKHIYTEYNISKNVKDLSNCSENEKNNSCEFAEEVCIEGPEVRNINGKEIKKDCWKWEKKYVCRKASLNSFIDECSEFKQDKNCKEIARECLYKNQKSNECEHYEVEYNCTNKEIVKRECIKNKFCIGDICKEKQRSSHNDFGKSISYLNILAGMKSSDLEGCKCPNSKETCTPNEIDTRSCKFFSGNNYVCRCHTGELNCCGDRGFLRGIFKCNQSEKDLIPKRQSGLCHHVGSWRGKKLEFYKKWQSHCCFKSKIAKIIQVQGRAQLHIEWGDRKNPDCKALTLDEIKRIDFSKIDFSEAFSEFEVKSKASIDGKQPNMKSKIEDLKNSPSQSAINKKIQEFYGGKK